ncbi:MAG: pseudouridine synthase [Elusimicrobia bacterium]|nr:pseudouridine synthase [Elusimicrobiota bacterium]
MKLDLIKLALLYKPYGVVSQFRPLGNHKTLAAFGLSRQIYPVGRLDTDSEGLLLLTNDGNLQHVLTDPQFNHPRSYWVQVERVPTPESLMQLAKGVPLTDGRTKPCQVKLLDQEPSLPPRVPPIRFRKTVPTAWLEITLTEGKNRQIRRMTASVGYPTLRLVRIRIGSFTLEGLIPGQWRYASREELKELRSAQSEIHNPKSLPRPSSPLLSGGQAVGRRQAGKI